MLTRRNYYVDQKKQIEQVVLRMIDRLDTLMSQCMSYLSEPSKENQAFMLWTEDKLDAEEKEIENQILNVISVQNLDVIELKWLMTMSRIIRELERCGDQLTNVMTVCNITSIESETTEVIERFFLHESGMVQDLKAGMLAKDGERLELLITRDEHVNRLNRETYKRMTHSMNENKLDATLGSKIIMMCRFLERFGDHLVNAGKLYKNYMAFEKENERIL
ncbi:phosphate transport system regulatory protein PhoU [Pullulanibacillus camelliae]|uniref:Phosphate transport system regulatory protein PhoU n=1 Tax=Pullulanibacillus camelliae TaxID=1707096 RepID=A0A8J2VJ09_9BACL|nr:PhoU domain-containing protein [Pullulanibacillus camelliae]GGE26837.1 phosphate transport system regulatory protein PhoU [Pullulanibacillus camelliae]